VAIDDVKMQMTTTMVMLQTRIIMLLLMMKDIIRRMLLVVVMIGVDDGGYNKDEATMTELMKMMVNMTPMMVELR
jgi:hypothetical protein